MDKYKFNPEDAFNRIQEHWMKWAASVGTKKWVIGISGGKDSTVVAALAARIFGKENVYGVMMPNGYQTDIDDSYDVCKHLGINNMVVNMGGAFREIISQICNRLSMNFSIMDVSSDTMTNLPARLRMATLYAVAQTIGGIVLNTCNLSEDTVGYATFGGDGFVSYAPIQGLTVTEIRQLGDWLELPHELIHKTPIDGLQPLSDEDKLGFTYQALDWYIREDIGSDGLKEHINELYRKNKFKTDIVHIPGPDFEYLGNFVRYNNLPEVRSGQVK